MKYLPNIKLGDQLSIQWPTGYGKSIGFAIAWKHCHANGIANRLLLVVANDTQRQQIVNDFASDCFVVSAPCNGGIWEFERSASDIQMAITGRAEVFVCTVQQLDASNRGGVNTLKDLLTARGTRWMIGFDEYHHYGEDMPWGDAAKAAMRHATFSPAMSATPYRRGADVIFPEPSLIVTYADAVQEIAVKPIVCVSYDYRVTVIDSTGETEYTTSELLEAAPDGRIDQWEERRNIRYSPQYIHPLIIHPLTRLMQKRAETGQKLQMLIRAMSCAHAETICHQVREYADGELSVDWIGTGPRGRSKELNSEIRNKFCPAKRNGIRPSPQLDILVQVSMAGEGFDSINVVEIVDIFPVSRKALNGVATSDKQFYGRGARIVPGHPELRLHVNVPSDHPLHLWAGKTLHGWMDSCGDQEKLFQTDEQEDRQIPDIDLFYFPELPRKREIELLNITTEDEHFVKFATAASSEFGVDFERDKQKLFEIYRKTAFGFAEQQSEQARRAQCKDQLDAIIGHIARILAKREPKINGSVIGKYKKEINAKLIRRFNKSRNDMLLDEIESAYGWCMNYLCSLKSES